MAFSDNAHVVSDPAGERRRVLHKMLQSGKASYADIIKRLNVLVIYNKCKNPQVAQAVKRDMLFVQKHEAQYSKSSTKRRSVKRRH